jgi:hypothetical protein
MPLDMKSMSEVAEREVYYFNQPGEQNTDLVVEAVVCLSERLQSVDIRLGKSYRMKGPRNESNVPETGITW